MHNLSCTFRFYTGKEGPSCLSGCVCVNTKIYKRLQSNIVVSRKLGMGKQNQTDGQKGLIKSGVHIATTACKNLSNMKTHQLGIS